MQVRNGMIWQTAQLENIAIDYIEHHIVDQCNLKCAGCSHFSPLCNNWFESIEDFKVNFNALATLTNKNVSKIRLMGGEPLLHPIVKQFLIECRNIFPDSEIELVTNGILLPKMNQSFINTCNNKKIVIGISDYGLFDINERLKPYDYIHTYEKVEMRNICLDLSGSQNKNNAFNQCEMHQLKCYYFQEDKLYPCSVIANIKYFNRYFSKNLFTSEEDMCISIKNHSGKEIQNFLDTPREFCKYCNTVYSQYTYHDFQTSKKDISEWVCPVDN